MSATGRRRARRHPPELWRVPVLRTTMVTPRMARITVGGAPLATFPGGGGDQHVVLYFYDSGVELPDPLTLVSARTMLGQVRPAMRSYTVRRHDPVAHELDFDFVLHGDGVASAWATAAQPGDDVILVGPSPAYTLDEDVPRHLLVGDETALPAIGALLAAATGSVAAVIEVADIAEEQPLPGVRWVHRNGGAPGTPDLLLAAVSDLELTGDIAVWAAGERSAMQALRTHLLTDRRLDRRQVRTTTYWRHGQAGTDSAGV
ncbi:MAG TPA: siderophore-interacting protein [Pseudonocardiaceae bacterium]|nr:siderophore-interacting protein [Pseudonocardiaceae bacterium]